MDKNEIVCILWMLVVLCPLLGHGATAVRMTFDDTGELVKTYSEVTSKIAETKQFNAKYGETISKNMGAAASKLKTTTEYAMILKDCHDEKLDVVDTGKALMGKFIEDQMDDLKKKGLKKLAETSRTFTVYNQVTNAIATYELTYEAGKWGVYAVVSTLPEETQKKMANSWLGQKTESLYEGIYYWAVENPNNVLKNELMPYIDSTVLPAIANEGLDTFARTVTEGVIEIGKNAKEGLEDLGGKANEKVLSAGNAVLGFLGYARDGFKDLFGFNDNDDNKNGANGKTNPQNETRQTKEENKGSPRETTSVEQVALPKNDMPGYESQSGDMVCYPDDGKPWGDSQPGDLVSLPIDDGKPEISLPGDLVSLPDDDDGQDDGDSIGDLLIDNIGLPLPTVHYTRLLYFFSGEEISNTLSDQLDSLLSSKFLKNLKKEVERLKQDWANFTKF